MTIDPDHTEQPLGVQLYINMVNGNHTDTMKCLAKATPTIIVDFIDAANQYGAGDSILAYIRTAIRHYGQEQ